MRDLPIIVSEIGAVLVGRIEAYSPNPWTHELKQKEGIVIEPKYGSMAADRVILSIWHKLV